MRSQTPAHRFGESLAQAIDSVIGALADQQHGVVARWQLRARGISSNAIQIRIENRRLRPVHRGVYLVGHVAAGPLATYAAAVLASGRGSAISHRSAAAIHAILPYPASAPVSVSVCTGGKRARPGLHVVRVMSLDPRDRTTIERIPVVTPARAILEIAAEVTLNELERACAEAHALRFAREPELRDQLERNPGRRGTRNLRLLLDRSTDPARTRSRLERRLLRVVRGSDLPQPETNQWIGEANVDMVWRTERLVVEADSYTFHSHSRPWARDLRKSNDLQLMGYRVLRFTWDDATKRPAWVIETIRKALILQNPR